MGFPGMPFTAAADYTSLMAAAYSSLGAAASNPSVSAGYEALTPTTLSTSTTPSRSGTASRHRPSPVISHTHTSERASPSHQQQYLSSAAAAHKESAQAIIQVVNSIVYFR